MALARQMLEGETRPTTDIENGPFASGKQTVQLPAYPGMLEPPFRPEQRHGIVLGFVPTAAQIFVEGIVHASGKIYGAATASAFSSRAEISLGFEAGTLRFEGMGSGFCLHRIFHHIIW